MSTVELSKTFLFKAIEFSQTVQTIPLKISIDYVYTQLNVKTVLSQLVDFNVSTVSILVGRVFANGPGRPGFNLRLSHTKDWKNGTRYLLALHSAL